MAKQWKETERRVAALVGGRRVPITGRARGDVPDIDHPWAAVEVKHWRRLPARVCMAMEQAEAAAGGEKMPVAVLHQSGDRFANALVVLRLGDFVELLAAIGHAPRIDRNKCRR